MSDEVNERYLRRIREKTGNELEVILNRFGSLDPEMRRSIGNIRFDYATQREKWEKEQTEKRTTEAPVLDSTPVVDSSGKYRVNTKGETLKLTLLVPTSPSHFSDIAKRIAKQWEKEGVLVEILAFSNGEFFSKMEKREYDMILFGQNLGYNLDGYAYWHSSQANQNGFNLSNYRSFQADDLLVGIRSSHDPEKRQQNLEKLQKHFAEDVPAILLFPPNHRYAVNQKVQGVTVDALALTQDRFSSFSSWYISKKRQFNEGKGWKDFWEWLLGEVQKMW